MVTQTIQGLTLSVDRGPNWLFINLRPNRYFARDIPHVADELWAVASRHFTYRLVLEFDKLDQMPKNLVDQLVILQERLAQCDGALRICGLSVNCAEKLRNQLADELPIFATRQAAVLGSEASALHEKLKNMITRSAGDDDMNAIDFVRHAPSLQ